ncbi:outer membrane protein assembly factor BamB family protein [Couchioplanes caeruleus]|uniref:Pyrrolo-quinoline quinone repeat domain-containing protein n=2 Tax=Couchioplanes caeruleus TaxID=56438 RepID=A0A1K0FGS8_9ACTN|nr:PQQ-binding-like beta-propeller repeat protein [Couchioplanes caeruleus]OJF12041.1 hypothetical protein BG844_22835 [Couchioplanes caeruleus subsp. caeruleus]ROP32691.1 putative pyrroloquinoline-quinone binding quinoprotein [Couchioplanes caeruleus]
MALIELGAETPAQPEGTTPPPAYVYRRLGLLLAAVLALALGGAAPATAGMWRHLGDVPLARATDYLVSGGRVYVLDAADDQAPRIAAWATDPVRQLWNVPGPPGDEAEPYFLSAVSDGVVLLRSGRTTAFLDAETGAPRWRSPTLVQPLGDRTGLVQEERFRPGTEYDPDSGAPGPLYGTTGEVLHTEPALSTSLSRVDLATGRRHWTVSEPGSISATATGGPHGEIVVLSAGRLAVRASATGAVLREREMPRANDDKPSWFELGGEVVLVHHGAFGERGHVTAYAWDTLAPLWQHDQPEAQGNAASCSGLPCRHTGTGLVVLDPGTGATLWEAGSEADLLAFGAGTVLHLESRARLLRTLDRRTGRPEIDLTPWGGSVPLPDGDAYLLTRQEPDGATVVGLLRAGAATVRQLGRLTGGVDRCRADATHVGCEVPGGVAIYRFGP